MKPHHLRAEVQVCSDDWVTVRNLTRYPLKVRVDSFSDVSIELDPLEMLPISPAAAQHLAAHSEEET